METAKEYWTIAGQKVYRNSIIRIGVKLRRLHRIEEALHNCGIIHAVRSMRAFGVNRIGSVQHAMCTRPKYLTNQATALSVDTRLSWCPINHVGKTRHWEKSDTRRKCECSAVNIFRGGFFFLVFGRFSLTDYIR